VYKSREPSHGGGSLLLFICTDLETRTVGEGFETNTAASGGSKMNVLSVAKERSTRGETEGKGNARSQTLAVYKTENAPSWSIFVL